MWCREEILDDGSKLSEFINKQHENRKYLPYEKIPDNVYAEVDLVKSVKDADILIFVIPHQFIKNICHELKDKIKANAFALTLTKVRNRKREKKIRITIKSSNYFIKGFYVDENTNKLILVSEIIKDTLNISCLCMMGGWLVCFFKIISIALSLIILANIAREVAQKVFCEATIGSRNDEHSEIIRQLIDRPYFRVRIYPDVEVIEILASLKNVIAMCAGFADGLKAAFNTRAAVCFLSLSIYSFSIFFFFVISRFFD